MADQEQAATVVPGESGTAPALSVVIVTHNVRALLRNCLEAVFGSQTPFIFEVIVVDTGLDGSAAMVRQEYAQFTRTKVIDAPENPGYAAANNLGLRVASGRFLLLLNPDTVVTPDAFGRTVAALEADSSIGVLGPKLVRGNGELDLAGRRSFPTPRSALFHYLRLPKLFPGSALFGAYNLTYRDPDEEYDVDAVVGAYMLIRRKVLDQIGLLDETYWMYGEDLDFCWRAKRAGWRTRYFPAVRVLHLKGQSSRTRSLRCTYWFYRSMHIFYSKHQAPTAPAAQNALVSAGIAVMAAAALAADRLRPAKRRRVS